eukprot:TRINITY_DN27616_c0_g1_i2.p2 TRINITY_DN27616_c0_g1~~TRINITY_DN27616_c0_g1_i2.p2  ORF type:complete len:142 (+),score=4.62 TRINITY_DN27616_c0_g1_i2:793-1218(+)
MKWSFRRIVIQMSLRYAEIVDTPADDYVAVNWPPPKKGARHHPSFQVPVHPPHRSVVAENAIASTQPRKVSLASILNRRALKMKSIIAVLPVLVTETHGRVAWQMFKLLGKCPGIQESTRLHLGSHSSAEVNVCLLESVNV